jgi:hypothetical protein
MTATLIRVDGGFCPWLSLCVHLQLCLVGCFRSGQGLARGVGWAGRQCTETNNKLPLYRSNIRTADSRFICQVKKQCIYININKIEYGCLATQTPEWPSSLRHCISVQEMSLQSLVRFQAVSYPALIASPIGRHTIGP